MSQLVTDSPGHSIVTAQEQLTGLREAIAAARTEAGGLLAGFRHAAGLSQVQLAGRIGYCRLARRQASTSPAVGGSARGICRDSRRVGDIL
jgi:hypothetical protein